MNKRMIIASMAVLPIFVGTVSAQSTEGVVTAASLNVRSGPSTSYRAKFIVYKGERVTIEESSNGWYKITTKDGNNGWASSKYIQTNQNTTITTTTKVVSVSSLNMRSGPSTSYGVIATLSKNTQVEVISVENGWAKIKYNSKTGYVSNQYLSDTKVGIVTQTKYVNTTGLNMRSGPATTYSIITTLSKNTQVEVISVENGWAKINYNSKTGYVSNQYLSDNKEEGITQTKYVNTTSLNVRSGPATTYKILKAYTYGQEVNVISIEGDWAKIKYEGSYAYLSNKYLTDKLQADTGNNNTDNNINNGTNSGGITGTHESLSYSFSTMVDYEYNLSQKGYNKIQAKLSTNYSNSSTYVKATREDLSKYLNPNTFSTNATGKLQFLRIDKYREGITASELNAYFAKYCKSHSVFLNKGQAFINAARKYNLDVTYLVAASMVETGYGTSTLAQGVYVTTPTGEKVKVYNFFGISAYDGTAVLSASNYAYTKGWTSIDKTIEGSAQWLSSNYIHSSKYNQNTLYKMRWSYNTGHQYATDVNWANTIARVMNNIIPYYGNYVTLEYLIPRYK